MKERVLIMGAGTVGSRDADVLLSLGIPVILCKYDALEDDIKTQELKAIINRHKKDLIEVRAARGSNIEERIEHLSHHLGSCEGSIDNMDFRTVSLAIDCTDKKKDVRNYAEIYEPKGLKFAVNGGGDDKLIKNLYFASVPNSKIQENLQTYAENNAKIVSCNTHAITTLLGLMKGILGKGKDFKEKLRDTILVDFSRRYEDPHKGKPVPQYVSLKHKEYHVEEVESIHPETEKLVDTTYSKWPTQYFHNITATFSLKDKVTASLVDDLRLAIQNYPRAILVEDELCHERTMNAAKWARISDADVPFPLYMVDKAGENYLRVYALTPQRGIVAPSTADYALLRLGMIPSLSSITKPTQELDSTAWERIFNFVNKTAKYRNENFTHIKNSIQDNLANYKAINESFKDSKP